MNKYEVGEYNPNPVAKAAKALWTAIVRWAAYWFFSDPNKVVLAQTSANGASSALVIGRTKFLLATALLLAVCVGVLAYLRPAVVVQTQFVNKEVVVRDTVIQTVHSAPTASTAPTAGTEFKTVYDPSYTPGKGGAVKKSKPNLELGKGAKEAIKKGGEVSNTLSNVNSDKAVAFARKEAYVKRFSKQAVVEMKQYGIPASITLAQAILESNAGQSSICVKGNSHFGVKCFSKSCKKGHCMNATDDTHKDFFRCYASAFESFRGHSKFLKDGVRYASLFKLKRTDYKGWAIGLDKAGYATAAHYDQALIGLVEQHKLYKYDK